jgi:dienelactone hydrolase
MRQIIAFLLLLVGSGSAAVAQTSAAVRTPEEFGYCRLVVMFGRDSVQVLVKSPKGEEQLKKPLLLWAQGSLPRPLIMYDERGLFGVLPFLSDSTRLNCHIVLISKPGIPLVVDARTLDDGYNFANKTTHTPPLYYCQRNYLEYYVRRDEAVLRYLKKQPWVDAKHVVVGGHSEGSGVVARLAATPGLISKAVYLSGSPLGRELTELVRDPADSTGTGIEMEFAQWQHAVDHPNQNDCTPGDSDKNVFSHGHADLPFLIKSQVPVFVGYGTRDAGAAANDYLRLEAIRLHKANFTFRPYLGREHNFFSFKNGKVNNDDWYWEHVGEDFLRWAGLWPQ